MLGLADIDQHPCRSIEHVTLGNPSLQTKFLFLGCSQDKRQHPGPRAGRTIIGRESTSRLYEGRAVDRVKAALNQFVSQVTVEIERVHHSFRELLLHRDEELVGGGGGELRSDVI